MRVLGDDRLCLGGKAKVLATACANHTWDGLSLLITNSLTSHMISISPARPTPLAVLGFCFLRNVFITYRL